MLLVPVDHHCRRVVFMASTEGGVEIEKVAEETPHLIHKVALDPLTGPMPYQGRELAFKLGLESDFRSHHQNLHGPGDRIS